MSRADRGPRSASIAVSIFALVLGAVLAAAIASFVVTFGGPPPEARTHGLERIADALRTGTQPDGRGIPLRIRESATAPLGSPTDRLPAAEARLAASLGVPVRDVIVLASAGSREISPTDIGPRDIGNREMNRAFFGKFVAAWHRGATWRTVEIEPPLFTHWHWMTLGTMLGIVVLLAGPAWWVARELSRPLRQLADTAAHARAGAPLGPIPHSGASEVRDLSRAIAAMHQRLALHAQERTTLLAAIAHDMGTPLARLAFRIEQLPDDSRIRALADIEEMRTMLGGALRLARDEAAERTDQRIDLGSLLDSLVEDMAVAGAPVGITPGARAVVRGDPAALRRLFGNLIENAVRYGGGAALGWVVQGGTVAVSVDDSGPGFDPAHAARLFEPFVRGEPSRNRDTGGAGLGLAIVRSIAEAHRGAVTLENHPGGGRVRIVLPAVSD